MKRSSIVELLAGAALLVSAFAFVAMAIDTWWSNRARLLGRTTWGATPAVLSDVPAPTFRIETLEGDTVAAPRAGSRSLVVAYATTCEFCNSSLKNWRRVVARVCDAARFVFVSREPIEIQRAYWAAKGKLGVQGCTAPTVGRVLDVEAFVEGYGVLGTPMHFVIGQDGYTSRTWRGAAGRRAARDSLISVLQQ